LKRETIEERRKILCIIKITLKKTACISRLKNSG
jgi:hypothetical protein